MGTFCCFLTRILFVILIFNCCFQFRSHAQLLPLEEGSQLKGLNLSAAIPEEFTSLTFLRELDFTRNYFNGSIPTFFSQLKNLSILGFLGNRLSGPIPREIGEIATLEELVLENNQLEGSLPENIGNLRNLRRLLLSANNFSGSIPKSFGNLKNLNDFRIDGSNLIGKIPDFIGNWTKLTILNLQGTSMEGPIPSNLSRLTNLEELRISDLGGASSNFPSLQDMKNMTRLILRNCLIADTIPENIGDLKSLKTLDLSFNQLTGQVPTALESLKINHLFLTNNSLTGEVPNWILISKKELDLSYNNFTNSSPASCQQSNVNLASSVSSSQGNSIVWCLRKDLPCPGKAKHHSLFINCGGELIPHEGNNYEEDLNFKGPSNFASIDNRWAYSSSGVFISNNEGAKYITTNHNDLNVRGAEYYKTARLSPQSLKYYGLCMRKGSYKVKLHFAEIMFTDDETYASLGKRIFDVLIQGKLVLKDFNIAKKAGGVGIGITEEFNDVWVNGSTLEVHLYWAGKGTNAIPDQGVYGPLISAITVTPNFKVDTGGLSAGVIVGIVVASCAVVVLLFVLLWMKGCFGGKDLENKEQGNLLELVDPSLGSKFSKEEALRMLNIALLCTNPSPTLRAPMSSVVAMLEGKVPVQAPIVKRSSDNQDARFKAFEILSQDSQTMVSTFSQESHSQISNSSMDGPWRDSSSVSCQTTDETREPSSSSMLLK
ncbi:hypothetical protein EZV62_007949 [Acer yangbiense]|uniref:non-specific serine/threonine protein kinase n=1 Tax=Acer yangbiense TaxID=1000413 RepID=A0A5C7IBY6_9ROSI|nr:hypothetical protein EZV62_007949 [Acer yangbiense]